MPTGTKSGCFGGYSHLLVVVSLFGLLIGMQNLLLYQKMRWALHVAEKTHMFVISSFYYDVSKSLPNNSIAIIFAARKHFVDFPITCKSRDAFGRTRDTKATSEILLVAPVQCKWTIMVAFCPVVPDPQRLSIEGDPGKRQVIPFRPADKTPRRFVVCMSRMFLFENWQLLISSLELYRHHGVDLIVTYISSVITDLYRILKAYESEGVLMLKPAIRFSKPADLDYDPNVENEWYNQDATYNSCLYEFKESAEFIMIADWDDVFIPKHHENYYNELLWLTDLYPKAASFIFQRPQTTIYTARDPENFDLGALVDSVDVSAEQQTGKFVGIPSRIDGIWIHAPTKVKRGYEVIELGEQHAQVYHFRRWNYTEDPIAKDDVDRTFIGRGNDVGNSFAHFLQRNNLTQTFLSLPKQFVYYPLLTQCYSRFITLLRHNSMEKCPSIPACDLPEKVNVSCINLEQHYTSTMLLNGFIVHYSALDDFVESPYGCAK